MQQPEKGEMLDDKTKKAQQCAKLLVFIGSKNLIEPNYRTQNQNVFIEYIQDITGNYGQTKKRNSELKFNYSAWVARRGTKLYILKYPKYL